MAKIINPSVRPIRLPTGHIVPANGTLDTSNETIRSTDNWPMLSGLAQSSQISLQFDKEVDPDGIVIAPVKIEVSPGVTAQAEADRQLGIAAKENLEAERALAEKLAAEAAAAKK